MNDEMIVCREFFKIIPVFCRQLTDRPAEPTHTDFGEVSPEVGAGGEMGLPSGEGDDGASFPPEDFLE